MGPGLARDAPWRDGRGREIWIRLLPHPAIVPRRGEACLAPRVRARRNGDTIELDAFAYSNRGVDLALVAEVKSRFREEHLADMKKKLADFPKFFPEHKDKELRGLVAAVDLPEQLAKRVLREGLYLARIRDDTFVLTLPADFEPCSWGS